MEKAIFGAFGTIGYELCNSLLERGIPVCHFNVGDEWENQDEAEEKMMKLGRNSNFSIGKVEPKNEGFQDYEHVILPVIDWENLDSSQKKKLGSSVQKILEYFTKLLFISIILRDEETVNQYFRVSREGVHFQRIQILSEKVKKNNPSNKRLFRKKSCLFAKGNSQFIENIVSMIEYPAAGEYYIHPQQNEFQLEVP